MKKTSVRPLEWVNKLLNRHGLTKPDGRPLYQYRVTDEEYLELQELLKLSVQMGFSNVSRMLSWDIAIVIYSAEWWRRYYAGQWSWEGIFGSIGLPLDEITIGRRNQFVELGLQRWNRDVRRLQGRRQFLGTIATEGGLPLNQLAEGGGWLKAILKPVIKKHLSRNLEIDLLIENYQDVIPSSYRSAEVKQILEDMVGAIVDLRKSHQLEEKSEPISWLDANVKQWRGHFPLPIGDETANALLIELVNVAARSKTEKGDDGLLFQVERFFTSVDHESEMQARLDAPAFVPIKRLNVDSGDQVPGRVEFELESDDGISRFWCRGIKTTYRHEETIKISTRSIQLKGQDALKGYKVVVKSFGEKITQLPIADGERLDIDIPWLFKESDGRFNLHGIASQSIKADKTVVYIPDRFDQDRVAESTEITKIIPIYEGALYKLAGQIICSDQLEKYKLKTNDEESAINYQIKGMLLLRDSIPAQIYIGAPSVDKLNTITGHVSRIPSDKLLGKPIGVDSPWRAMRPNDVGVFELRVIDADGSIAYRRKVGILPEDFCYTLQPDKTIKNKGSISIGISEENAISVDGENCVSNVKQGAGVLVELSTAEIPPQSIKVYILPRGHKNELVLSLPYPAKGALLFNPSNKLVNNKLPLYLNNLYGYRVDYFTDKYGPHIKGKLRFKLSDSSLSSSQAQDVYVEKPFTIREQVTEFAVIDWYQIIQNMLGVSKSLDSSVEISLLIGGSEEFRLSVGRYQHKLSLDWEGGSLALDSDVFSEIDVEEIEKTEVHTIWLRRPEQASIPLPAVESQGCHLGQWVFSPDIRSDGPWLIFSTKESSLQFRPVLWEVGENLDQDSSDVSIIESIHTLQQAIRISDPKLREKGIRLVLSQMAIDLDHKSWDYLENLTRKCGHLPLATFDVWRTSISETHFLATLLVKKGFEDIIERLEIELPIIWELVRLDEWQSALEANKKQLLEIMSDDGDPAEEDHLIVQKIIDNRIEKIEGLSASMMSVSAILRSRVLADGGAELMPFRDMPDAFWGVRMQEEFQNLMRRQYESDWPPLLGPQLRNIFDQLPDRLKAFINTNHNHQDPVVFMPVILAWRVNTDQNYGWLGSPVNVFKLEQLKNFDEDWFSVAFQYLSGWISQQLKLDDEEVING